MKHLGFILLGLLTLSITLPILGVTTLIMFSHSLGKEVWEYGRELFS